MSEFENFQILTPAGNFAPAFDRKIGTFKNMAPKIDKQIKLSAMSELDGAPRLYMGVEPAPISPLPWILKIYERELSYFSTCVLQM